MKLIGKCKEDFDNYLFKKSIWKNWFYTLIPSMQYGVYVDFFDSVGISVSTNDWKEFNEILFLPSVKKLGEPNHFPLKPCYFTRSEARIKALEKANEIYNNN